MAIGGARERRRRQQLLSWMWDMVDEGLRTAVREHPGVDAALRGLEEDILEGRTTPTTAAETILRLFGTGPTRVGLEIKAEK
jgi:LAO/AO transport system kinase